MDRKGKIIKFPVKNSNSCDDTFALDEKNFAESIFSLCDEYEFAKEILNFSKDGIPTSFKHSSYKKLAEIYCKGMGFTTKEIETHNRETVIQAYKDIEETIQRTLTTKEVNALAPIIIDCYLQDNQHKLLAIISLLAIFKDARYNFLNSESDVILKLGNYKDYDLDDDEDFFKFHKNIDSIIKDRYGVFTLFKNSELSQDEIDTFKSIPDVLFIPDMTEDNLSKFSKFCLDSKFPKSKRAKEFYDCGMELFLSYIEDVETDDNDEINVLSLFNLINDYQDFLSFCSNEVGILF